MALVYRTFKLPKIPEQMSLKDYYEIRNTILVVRQSGGVGDILMSRMIFEDFKKLMPEVRVVYACPKAYHQIIADHPFIDEVVDCNKVEQGRYNISYNISTACGKYEQSIAPFSDKHRSDIWANHCGIELTMHNMHLSVNEEDRRIVKNILNRYREPNKPIVLFSPISAMKSKNLDTEQMNGVAKGLEKMGCVVLGLHKQPIYELCVTTLDKLTLRQWLAAVDEVDYIVTVDTGTFHAAGGLNKPTTAIFSWADGKVYGKWYNNYILVQKHRDDGNWDCGPCYWYPSCPKCKTSRKPCITELTVEDILRGCKRMIEKWRL